ncbi:hypothetical protein MHU86_21750 [Fragilaria crotonensis]|nr:hypothetical protein MHU86_21750 [Fragilaria crotonensis]
MRVLLLLSCVVGIDAFSTIVLQPLRQMPCSVSTSRPWMSVMDRISGELDDWSSEMQSGDNPCWQDLYDDDCSMESIYAASFVASKWIKSMPCGAGIEDCDMPEALQTPQTKENGVAAVDVMAFLGLERRFPPEEASH